MNRKQNHSSNGQATEGYIKLPKTKEFEMFAIVTKMEGANHLRAKCADGIERLCRITGKMKKTVWIREGDLILIKVWDYQPSKADIIWRYLGPQRHALERKGHLNWLTNPETIQK
ncbi:MAG: translation initiation factor eIF-1A [archaeon]